MEPLTVLLPARPEQLAPLLRLLEQRAVLISSNGARCELPTEVLDALHLAVRAMSAGMAVTVTHHPPVLTTSEAAQLLGVPHPALIRLLEAGEIPFEQIARHRRVRLVEVLVYRERVRRR